MSAPDQIPIPFPRHPPHLPGLGVTFVAGGWVVTCEEIPGWSMRAKTANQLVDVIVEARITRDTINYAAQRGLLPPDDPRHDEPAQRRRPRVQDCRDWRPLRNGDWLSPNGRRYSPGSARLAAVIAARLAQGIPVEP